MGEGEWRPWDDHLLWCSGRGYLEVLGRRARANGCPWDEDIEDTCSAAREEATSRSAVGEGGGAVERDDMPCSSGRGAISSPAVAEGKWLPVGSGGIRWAAAKGGHLEVLQWLKANGCPWHARGMPVERECMHFAVGAHAGGCPCDARICNNAGVGEPSQATLLGALGWAETSGCPRSAGCAATVLLKHRRAAGCRLCSVLCL